ncbi:MAG TPA: tRNA 5-methoxyuridine(34)/uridine 5-oxyacetic acid(34) synthase CmoB [Polyangiaceae bacterium]|nr:tRNA 5-methoxyuridine(34)/uridine 5-oxyacetic acid(34) synthase CmoB [Polyangiaceae bacterium]
MTEADWRALHFEPLSETLACFGYSAESVAVPEIDGFQRHGDVPRWRSVVDALPLLSAVRYRLDQPIVAIGNEDELEPSVRRGVLAALEGLRPWRKGPFRVFGVDVDAEWRSDLKWSRVERAVRSLEGHRVLDVGCGNGYYCLRALGAGAASVLGVEPSPLFVLQFELLKRLLPPLPAAVLPLHFEALPSHPRGFDTVFSMGLLYHRKSPLDHLRRLVSFLAEGGQLVLETLIVEPRFGPVFEPRGRYATMGNVWSIPSVPELSSWLEQAGLEVAQVADITVTSPAEQRTTPWSGAHSLREALDPNDSQKTIEGHPAPQRALVVAHR